MILSNLSGLSTKAGKMNGEESRPSWHAASASHITLGRGQLCAFPAVRFGQDAPPLWASVSPSVYQERLARFLRPFQFLPQSELPTLTAGLCSPSLPPAKKRKGNLR